MLATREVDLGDGAVRSPREAAPRPGGRPRSPPGRSRPRAPRGRPRSAARPARRPPAPRRTGRRRAAGSRRRRGTSARRRSSSSAATWWPCHRRAAEGRLQPGEPAVGRRVANRADPVGAHRAAHQPGGDGGAGPARRAPGAAIGVPRVAGRAEGGDVPGAAGPVLVHVRHPDDHRPGVAKGAIGPGLTRLRRRAEVLRGRRGAPPATAAATRP